ncbi:ATP synthase subunit a [Vitis vinifera]|uniref:F-ATPase protein 6 n=1 Tax=Vitis vinifera TaxID=29760 RepID=A0A438FWZ0_VITVI|nr:ATP synthase subunit a [Vitis vinifera]
MLKVVAHLLSFKHFFLYAHFDARFLPCFGPRPDKAGDIADMSQAERPSGNHRFTTGLVQTLVYGSGGRSCITCIVIPDTPRRIKGELRAFSLKRSLGSGLVSIAFRRSEPSGRMDTEFGRQVIAFERDNSSTIGAGLTTQLSKLPAWIPDLDQTNYREKISEIGAETLRGQLSDRFEFLLKEKGLQHLPEGYTIPYVMNQVHNNNKTNDIPTLKGIWENVNIYGLHSQYYQEALDIMDDLWGARTHSPLEQFSILPLIPMNIGNLYFSFTNPSLFMLLTLSLVLLLVHFVTKNGGGNPVPNAWQSLVEFIHDFVSNPGKLKNSHKGRVVRKFRTRGGVMRKFRTSTIHPPKCKIGFFQMVITSSFQIQIAHRLKHWTPNFLSFKKRYGMHNLSSRKCSKNVSNSSKMRCGCNIPFSFAQSSSNGHNFFVLTPNRALFEAMDS